KKLALPASDAGRKIFLDVDGAMSYASVWFNGQLVGGWPYGYASWQVDVTPYARPGEENQLAIRLDNPPDSSRWYPGAGLYRNVWLVTTAPVHVGHWGTQLTTPAVSASAALIQLLVTVDNESERQVTVRVSTALFRLDAEGHRVGAPVANLVPVALQLAPHDSSVARCTGSILRPQLWGPPPRERPNRCEALTTIWQDDTVLDEYATRFGIRTFRFDANEGFFINGEHTELKGVCLHHDLGALGAALNQRALRRQLETLREMGCNAIRTSHNPPAPELLE